MLVQRTFCTISLLLVACGEPQETTAPARLAATDYLAGDDVDGYLRVTEPRAFFFPQDHGSHPGYRNEWWYLTGNMEAVNGQRFGYQVTFFKTAIRPDAGNDCEAGVANWCSNHVWMGHAALSDVANRQHHNAELFSRDNPGLAGARLNPFRVWIQDWQMFSAGNGFPWELEVITEDFALTLNLDPAKGPVLQGDRGLSRKSPEPGNASYYYSLTRIVTSGQVHVDGDTFPVTGSSWLDREWSTSALAADQSGWDWFSLQFDDGTELMYYQLRNLEGDAHSSSAGNFTSLMGTQTPIAPESIVLEEVKNWTAPDGTAYTTTWHMQYRDSDWLIRALFDNQLMDLTFQYWEGAVEVSNADSGEVLGRGYLEMVR